MADLVTFATAGLSALGAFGSRSSAQKKAESLARRQGRAGDYLRAVRSELALLPPDLQEKFASFVERMTTTGGSLEEIEAFASALPREIGLAIQGAQIDYRCGDKCQAAVAEQKAAFLRGAERALPYSEWVRQFSSSSLALAVNSGVEVPSTLSRFVDQATGRTFLLPSFYTTGVGGEGERIFCEKYPQYCEGGKLKPETVPLFDLGLLKEQLGGAVSAVQTTVERPFALVLLLAVVLLVLFVVTR